MLIKLLMGAVSVKRFLPARHEVAIFIETSLKYFEIDATEVL